VWAYPPAVRLFVEVFVVRAVGTAQPVERNRGKTRRVSAEFLGSYFSQKLSKVTAQKVEFLLVSPKKKLSLLV